MTIGIGCMSISSVLLGCDREITSGWSTKYKGEKFQFQHFDGNRGVVATTYSGVEDDARNVWKAFGELVRAAEETKSVDRTNVQLLLGNALRDVKPDKQFQMLGVVGHPSNPVSFFGEPQPDYFRVQRITIAPAKDWELIGAGNCELSRYLTGLFDARYHSVSAQILWMIKIIQTANSFVQGVGQGIQVAQVTGNGKYFYFDCERYLSYLKNLEIDFSAMWADVCDLEMPEEELKNRLRAFAEDVIRSRALVPKSYRFGL